MKFVHIETTDCARIGLAAHGLGGLAEVQGTRGITISLVSRRHFTPYGEGKQLSQYNLVARDDGTLSLRKIKQCPSTHGRKASKTKRT